MLNREKVKQHDLVDPNHIEIEEKLVIEEGSSQGKVVTWANRITRMDNIMVTLVTRGRMSPETKASLISMD